jgi:glycosyltransferase involved in cell wall biosynthesis
MFSAAMPEITEYPKGLLATEGIVTPYHKRQSIMRVIYIATPATSPSFSAKVSQALIDGGAKVRVFKWGVRTLHGSYEESIVPTTASIAMLPRGRRSWFSPQFYMSRFRLATADIIVADHPSILQFATLWRDRASRLIYMPFEYYPDVGFPDSEKEKEWDEIELRYAKEVTCWIACGAELAELYASRGVPRNRLHVSFIGGVPRALPGPERLLRKRIGVSDDVVIVLYQGYICEEDGIWDVMYALSELPTNVHFVALGFGKIEALRKDAARFGLRDRIHILDAVPQRDLLMYTADANIGVIPFWANCCQNSKYCNPSKLFEYAAGGLALAVSRLPELERRVKRDGLGEVFEPGCVKDLSRALRKLACDVKYRQLCAANSRQVHEQETCWEIQAEKLRRIILG